MDQRTLTDLRQLADHLVSLQQRVTDGLDELRRRLSAAEDTVIEGQQSLDTAEYHRKVQTLRAERGRL